MRRLIDVHRHFSKLGLGLAARVRQFKKKKKKKKKKKNIESPSFSRPVPYVHYAASYIEGGERSSVGRGSSSGAALRADGSSCVVTPYITPVLKAS